MPSILPTSINDTYNKILINLWLVFQAIVRFSDNAR